MADNERLAHRLKSRRMELGLTLKQVADKAELSIPYVSNLERGVRNPTVSALTALAAALDTEVADLVGSGVVNDEDLLTEHLATAPDSLRQFARSDTFKSQIRRWAEAQKLSEDEMRGRVLLGMAAAPRRSAEAPTQEDWRRLLDAYDLILRQG
jgi:transcriptional regulator with XRE-family HTH domain